MAERRVYNVVQQMMTCAFCMEEVRNPRALQCQHTFCLECLIQYVKTKKHKDQLECPTCRRWCPVPKGGLHELQVNFFINQLKDAAREDEAPSGDVTKTDGLTCSNTDCLHKAARVFCQKCGYLCGDCGKDHKSRLFMRKHTVLPILETRSVHYEDLPLCPKHEKYLLELYCQDCQMPLCSKCVKSTHVRHNVVEIYDKALAAKAELRTIIEQAEGYLKTTQDVTASIQHQVEKVDQDSLALQGEVVSAFTELYKELKTQEQAFLSDVDEACQLAQKKLHVEVDRQEMLQATLQSIVLCGNQLLQHGKPCDYLTSVPSLSKQLQDNNPEKVPCVLEHLDVTLVQQKLNSLKAYDWTGQSQRQDDLILAEPADEDHVGSSQDSGLQTISALQEELKKKEVVINEITKDNRKMVEQLLHMIKPGATREHTRKISMLFLTHFFTRGRNQNMLVGDCQGIARLLEVVEDKVSHNQFDQLLLDSWSCLWNFTDEMPINAERFLQANGMTILMRCLKKFKDEDDLLRRMLGVVGNTAEVESLRPYLMHKEYIKAIMSVLEHYDVTLSYPACRVLIHLIANGPTHWCLSSPSYKHVCERIVNTIQHWKMGTKIPIRYSSLRPFLEQLTNQDCYQAQYFSVWALCNFTEVNPEMYCPMLKKEKGIDKLKELSTTTVYPFICDLAKEVITKCDPETWNTCATDNLERQK